MKESEAEKIEIIIKNYRLLMDYYNKENVKILMLSVI